MKKFINFFNFKPLLAPSAPASYSTFSYPCANPVGNIPKGIKFLLFILSIFTYKYIGPKNNSKYNNKLEFNFYNNNNKFNLPEWLKYILVFILLFIFNYIIVIIFNKSYVALVLDNLSFFILFFVLILLYLLLNIYLIKLFSKSNNIQIPNILPFLIKKKNRKY